MIYVLILAGGAGTRFWPLSRKNAPKQFINFSSGSTMLEQTVRRLQYYTDTERIFIAANERYADNLNLVLRSLPVRRINLLFEPESRNTFAPIAWFTNFIFQRDKDAVILVLPSDHLIEQSKQFKISLDRAQEAAKNGYIVTLGIRPDRPETGYGYIKAGRRLSPALKRVSRVEKFVEKPNLFKAERFIQDKRYFWNGGIFVFQAKTMLCQIQQLMPQDYRVLIRMKGRKISQRLWGKLTPLSIDYAIMERSKKLALVEADFGWRDMGSLNSLEFLLSKNKDGNIFRGNCIDIGSKNMIALGRKRLLATIGLEGLIIIDTDDALLVCPKEKAQEVKKIAQLLKEKGLDRLA